MPLTPRETAGADALASGRALSHLVQRLSLTPGGQTARVIAFIAARPGEGTSTVARHYAATLVSETGQKVLRIDAAIRGRAGIVDAFMDAAPPGEAVSGMEDGVATGHWLSESGIRPGPAKAALYGECCKALLTSFDFLIIDAPALQRSFEGILLAAKADAAVLVIEAEATPPPVAERLQRTLAEAGANVAGVVMNKRRFYIPEKMYKRL